MVEFMKNKLDKMANFLLGYVSGDSNHPVLVAFRNFREELRKIQLDQ